MTANRYQITVSGLIGPTLTSAIPGFTTDTVTRHHVLLVPANAEDHLLPVLTRLDECGIEVDQVIARYR